MSAFLFACLLFFSSSTLAMAETVEDHAVFDATDNALDVIGDRNYKALPTPIGNDEFGFGNSDAAPVVTSSDSVKIQLGGNINDTSEIVLPVSSEASMNMIGEQVIVNEEGFSDPDFSIVSDGKTVQIHAILGNKTASERIPYTIEGASSIEIDKNTGAAFIYRVNDSGEQLLDSVIDTPWAIDANGKNVPTWFETDGNVLTQVVEHKSGEFAYPIVADPSWSEVWEWAKKAGKVFWRGTKWVLKKGLVFARWVGPGAFVLCAVGGGWAWYRSDSDGWVRVGDTAVGCFT
ncbi:hypothetical protein [Corynebacterium felinum]|uniref:hypothetical protein n=1 Tax=Corynebacterium felinum TaxID=131318 RepID=UPI00286AA4B4|nr:hypothetical protein [Corynebacterium felinum]